VEQPKGAVGSAPSARAAVNQPAHAWRRDCLAALYGLQACPEADPTVVARLLAQRDRLDPFGLSTMIDQKLERLVGLATPSRAPSPPSGAPDLGYRPNRRHTTPPPPPRRDSRSATAGADAQHGPPG